MARRITKKLLAARTAFKTRVSNFLKSVGASQNDGTYEWKLATPIGDLSVGVWDSAIMCRFADVEQGKAFTGQFPAQQSNPYSGKWNWHFEDDADTLNGNCEAQFVRYVKLLMSLETLPEDLTTLTPDQTEKFVTRLSKFPLAELRRRQDLANRQIELAFTPSNEAALANLHVRVEHLRMAVDRQAFEDHCRSVGMSPRP